MAANPAARHEVPDSPHVVTASPVTGGPPQEDWDATDKAPVSGWAAVDDRSGITDLSMNVTRPFEDGPDRWKQT